MLREGRRWKKGILFFNLCMALFLCPLCVKAEEADKEVTIYGLGSSDKEAVSIPSELPESYQFSVGNGENVTYSIASGSSAKVSADGVVTPKYAYWKRQSGFSISVSEGQEYDYYTLSSGDTKIVAKTADKTYNLTVHVKDYAITYGDEVMDAYLQDNVNDTMTDEEIMKAIARFPASFDYSASHSSVYSMIIYGGGDCWASTNAIIALCKRLGIRAWSRNGNKDAGAGSGHRNAMAELNGVYYELEAGYAMAKKDGYRPYSVIVRDSLFSYSYASSNSLSIYQYDGYDTTGVLEIPEQIGGKTVTEIGKSVFAGTEFSEIKLPDTVTAIGDFAFSSCKNLTSIQIPASVTSIGASAFVSCEKLEDISIASGNLNYKAENQVIYTKDGSTLVTCPVAGEVLIPSTVTKIADYAFYYNGNLKRIVIPKSVTEMGEGAFGNCSKLSEVLFEGDGLISVGTHCFRSNSSLSVIRIPSSVKSLGAYAFAYCNKLKNIYFMGEAPEFGETIEGTVYDNVFTGCTGNAYYIEDSGTWTDEVLSGHGGTIEWSAWNGKDEVQDTEETDKNDDKVDDTPKKDEGDGKTDDIPNKDEDDKKTEDVTQYYDSATGMTVCVKDKSKKTAVLTSVGTKHIKKTMSIPNKVILDGTSYTITEIGKKAFKNNKKLERVVIGDKVETVGAEAFSGCKKLKTVTIGKNVKAIGSKAFYKCKKLKSITIKTTKLTGKTVGSKAFKDIYAKASIKVPKSKLAAYKKLLKTKGVGKKAKIKK